MVPKFSSRLRFQYFSPTPQNPVLPVGMTLRGGLTEDGRTTHVVGEEEEEREGGQRREENGRSLLQNKIHLPPKSNSLVLAQQHGNRMVAGGSHGVGTLLI